MHNKDAEPLTVVHADLERAGGGSPFRSKCPKCPSGLLLIMRDRAGTLVREDACVACAQRVVYLDETINGETLVAAKDARFPCPHGQNSWKSCPHCLGLNQAD
jgi:hypothetical protein